MTKNWTLSAFIMTVKADRCIAEHPTEKDKDGKPIMIPEMIFGHLLTSTNYEKDEKKIVGGVEWLWC